VYKVSVFVTPKKGVADPQGAVVERALPALGYNGVSNIRVGRYITLELEGADELAIKAEVEGMCRKLLANPIIEDYWFEISRSLVDGALPGTGDLWPPIAPPGLGEG
jgi:phosphoribosylformylglycinamidine synthase PurS subunit